MSGKYFIVTGAPGDGKSSIVKELLSQKPGFMIYDIDWLVEAASKLSGKDVIFEQSVWEDYRNLWFTVLQMTLKNSQKVVFFAAIDKDDIAELGSEISNNTAWCLLDCDDKTRKARLEERSNWTSDQSLEAVNDAKKLREQIEYVISSDTKSISDVAREVRNWIGSN